MVYLTIFLIKVISISKIVDISIFICSFFNLSDWERSFLPCVFIFPGLNSTQNRKTKSFYKNKIHFLFAQITHVNRCLYVN